MTDPEATLAEVRDLTLAGEEVPDDKIREVVDYLRAKREASGGRGPAKKKTAKKKATRKAASTTAAADSPSLKDLLSKVPPKA